MTISLKVVDEVVEADAARDGAQVVDGIELVGDHVDRSQTGIGVRRGRRSA